MSNLLSRAHSLINNKTALIGALAILPLAAATQKAQAITAAGAFTFNSGSGAFERSSGGATTDPNATLVSQGNNPIRLSTTGPITVPSSTYTNLGSSSYNLAWTGTLNSSFFPAGGLFTENYDFIIGLSSGTADWTLTTIFDNEPNVIQSGEVTGASTHIISSTSEILPQAATAGGWTSTLSLNWFGFSGPSTMTINVPGLTSIDLAIAATPEPASLTLLALGTATLLTRRRRTA